MKQYRRDEVEDLCKLNRSICNCQPLEGLQELPTILVGKLNISIWKTCWTLKREKITRIIQTFQIIFKNR